MGKDKKRKLTPAEEKRAKVFEHTSGMLIAQGYAKHDLTIGIVYANIMACVIGIPIVVLFGFLFVLRNQEMSFHTTGIIWSYVIFIVGFIVLTVVHELIHGITWGMYASEHMKAIEFGFIKEYLTPYCTCKEALQKGQYIVGALMPTILLGLIPLIVSVFTGQVLVYLLGAVMFVGGGGDMTIILKLLRYQTRAKDVVILDHPYECGLVAFER